MYHDSFKIVLRKISEFWKKASGRTRISAQFDSETQKHYTRNIKTKISSEHLN